jgi:regulator of sigma D
MKWYRFWKTVRGYNSGESYEKFSNESTEDIKDACESWVDSISGGHNFSYSCAFEQVEKPPKKWTDTSEAISKMDARICPVNF